MDTRDRIVAIALFALLTCAFAVAQGASGDQAIPTKDQPQTRNVSGQVMDQRNVPLPNAIVYLKNTKTLGVKSFITSEDGNYRFAALIPNVDYEIYAERDGHRSSTKTLSGFDMRANVVMNLRIKTK